MASSYPGALDSFSNPSSTDAMDASAALYHDVQHANANDAIEAVQAELGTDPAGGAATVKARLEYGERHHGTSAGVWPSGTYVITTFSGNTASSATLGANELTMAPFWCPAAVTLDRIAVEVTTQQASANARLGVYASTTGGEPGSLLFDGGEIDCSTAAVKSLTISQALAAGTLYWLAVLNETASVAYRSPTINGGYWSIGTQTTSGTTSLGRIYVARTYTDGFAATADAWSSYATSDKPPMFWLRRT